MSSLLLSLQSHGLVDWNNNPSWGFMTFQVFFCTTDPGLTQLCQRAIPTLCVLLLY